MPAVSPSDLRFLRLTLRLAAKAYGHVSPNPLVGAVLVKQGRILGQGWHHQAGQPHAEIEALRDAQKRGANVRGATLYVSLEPCCTHGRTPPCTEAILAAGIARVVVATTDPNPAHAGHGLKILTDAGVEVVTGPPARAARADELNAAFNHWIVHRTPLVTVKAAMTLDGKIATAAGESKWITGPKARAHAMHLRLGSDAILVGVNTVLLDDPGLTYRPDKITPVAFTKKLRRLVLDPRARTPLTACVVTDNAADLTTIVVTDAAPAARVKKLAEKVSVLRAPVKNGRIHLPWLLKKLGSENVTSLLVEGGGETNAAFLEQGVAHRVAFFYAPKILGGRTARTAVAGSGFPTVAASLALTHVRWQTLAPDLLLTARLSPSVRT